MKHSPDTLRQTSEFKKHCEPEVTPVDWIGKNIFVEFLELEKKSSF